VTTITQQDYLQFYRKSIVKKCEEVVSVTCYKVWHRHIKKQNNTKRWRSSSQQFIYRKKFQI